MSRYECNAQQSAWHLYTDAQGGTSPALRILAHGREETQAGLVEAGSPPED